MRNFRTPPPHAAVFAHDHRRDGLAALDRRDVEALDAARHAGQGEHGAQRFERVVVGRGVLVEALLIGERGVARREVEQAALLAALGTTRRTRRPALDDSHSSRTPRRSPSSSGRCTSGGGTRSS